MVRTPTLGTGPSAVDEARLRLINWTYGQLKAETLGAQILRLEGYLDIDPVHPTGGPDGGKDIIARHPDGRRVVGGCYFPNRADEKSWEKIEGKFDGDLDGAVKNSAKIFAFLTNVQISDDQGKTLRTKATAKGCAVEIFDLDRVAPILNSPKGFGLRYQILSIKMSDEEQVSFFNNWESILLAEVQRVGAQLNQVSGQVGGIEKNVDMILTILKGSAGTGEAKSGDAGALV